MGDLLPLLLSVALAAAVQTVSGFGFSLIMMPLAVLLLGLPTAAPLVALIGLVVSLVNAVRNRKAVDPRELRVLALVAIVGVPVGVWLLSSVNEDVVKAGLGILLIAYASFSLLRPNVGRPIGPQWGYPAGFIAAAWRVRTTYRDRPSSCTARYAVGRPTRSGVSCNPCSW